MQKIKNKKEEPNHFKMLRKQAEQLLHAKTRVAKEKIDADVYSLLHELSVHQIELEMQNDELQQTLRQLNESQSRYQELYEFAPIGYFSLDENNLIMEVNLAGSQLLGTERSKLLKKRFSRFITKNSQPIFYSHRQQAFAAKTKQRCELELIAANGSIFYAHLESIVVQKTAKDCQQLRISLIDITERKRMEEGLTSSEEKFRSFVETTKEWIWAIDIGGRFTYSNPSIEFILGYYPKELLQRNRMLFVHQEERDFVIKILTEAIKQKSGWNNVVIRWRHKNGSYRYLESNALPMIDNDGCVLGFRGADRDITLRKEAEEQMRRRQQALNRVAKMRSMGELASALAHELTQPLAAINNFATGCVCRLESGNYQPQELLEAMKQTEQQAVRAGEIIHHMKSFVRQRKLYYEEIDLHEVIREVVVLIKKEWALSMEESAPPLAEIRLEFARSPVCLTVDRIQIELVLLNLLRNSIEAITEAVSLVNREVIIRTQFITTEWAIVSIIDTGPGFNQNTAEQLFEPCFTTKQEGLGMGLSISRTIVEAHGGQISAKSVNKNGACFEFSLPIRQKINNDAI
jgi:PAS domain S-box-containing protein